MEKLTDTIDKRVVLITGGNSGDARNTLEPDVPGMIPIDEESSGSSPRDIILPSSDQLPFVSTLSKSEGTLSSPDLREKKEVPPSSASTLSSAAPSDEQTVANLAVPARKAKPKASSMDAALTPEDVPRSKDPYQINEITTCFEWFRLEELKYMIMIACIDGEMRETITFNWGCANALLEVVDSLLSIPEGQSSFPAEQALFQQKLVELKAEELKLYKSLLGARTHIILKGVETEITRELKGKLLLGFEKLVDAKFGAAFQEFTPVSFENLEGLKKELEKRIEEMLLLKDDMLESKVAIHMKSEDLKVTPEYKALIVARKKFRSIILTTSLWDAADRKDSAMLTAELAKASRLAVLLPDEKRFVNQRNPLGYSALHIACFKGDTTGVTLLLGANASRKIRDLNGYQALHWAAAEGHLAVCTLLLQRDKTILDARATVKNEKGEEVGIIRGKDGSERGGYGRTALHRASFRGHHPAVKLLVDEGADPNARTTPENGSVTPLHEAIAKGHNLVISELLKSPKMEVEVTAERGRSPLWWAVAAGRTDYVVLLAGHKSYKRFKDPQDPNSIDNLLKLTPPINQEKMKALLEDLKITCTPAGK